MPEDIPANLDLAAIRCSMPCATPVRDPAPAHGAVARSTVERRQLILRVYYDMQEGRRRAAFAGCQGTSDAEMD